MSMYQIMALAWSETEWAVMRGPRSGGLSMNHILLNVRAERIKAQELKWHQRLSPAMR